MKKAYSGSSGAGGKNSGVKFLVVGRAGNNAFIDILKRLGVPYSRTGLEGFEAEDAERYSSLIFMPGYFEWQKDLPAKERILRKLKGFSESGRGLYIEYVQWDDYVFRNVFNIKQNHPPRPAALERVVVAAGHYITQDFGSGSILPLRNCVFLPCHSKVRNHLLCFAVVRGTDRVICGMPPERDVWPALVENEGTLFSTFEISKYKANDFPLQKSWERIAARTLLYLIPPGRRAFYQKKLFPPEIVPSPRVWGPPGEKITFSVSENAGVSLEFRGKKQKPACAGGVYSFVPESEGRCVISAGSAGGAPAAETIRVCARRKKYEETLDRLMNWYFASGVMPGKDGSAGVYEGFRSTDHKLMPVLRTDCNAETALALLMYGKYKKNGRCSAVAGGIVDFLLEEGFQDLNPRNSTLGLWKFWNDYLDYPRTVWCNDNSLAGLALFSMYEISGNKKYLKHALLTSSGAYRAGLEGFTSINGKQLNEKGAVKYRKENNYGFPSFNPFAPTMYARAYRHTGDRKYLSKAEKVAEGLKWHPTSVQMNIYSISMFSALYSETGRETYKKKIDRTVNSLTRYRAGCGAVLNPRPNKKKTNDRYGIAEVDVTHLRSDTVADQLYVSAPLVFNLYEAYRATGEKKYRELFIGIMDFLARIQLRSADRRLDGAWMRAFDYAKWDYNGSNGDIDWGPYCIESGWTNTWIAKALISCLADGEV